jgi:hypothetical protein
MHFAQLPSAALFACAALMTQSRHCAASVGLKSGLEVDVHLAMQSLGRRVGGGGETVVWGWGWGMRRVRRGAAGPTLGLGVPNGSVMSRVGVVVSSVSVL